MKNNRQRGKATQKAIAKIFDGLDIGILGGVDVLADDFIIECKSRKKFSGISFLEQAEKDIDKHKNKIPIAVVHIYKTRHQNDVVLIRLKDFLKILDKRG